jgi:hypothetical protein
MMLIVLALLGFLVLVVSIAPPDPGVQSDSTDTPASTVPVSNPDAFDVSVTLDGDAGEPERTIEAELGDRVEIVVEASGPDTVSLGGLDLASVEAGIPARFELLAETTGAYPLDLIEEGRRIGTLEIR